VTALSLYSASRGGAPHVITVLVVAKPIMSPGLHLGSDSRVRGGGGSKRKF